MDEATIDELTDYLSETPMQWVELPDGKPYMAFPDSDMAEMVSDVLWHLYGLTFTLRRGQVACLLVPVVH